MIKKLEVIKNFKEKTAQGQSDKLELMRDLATYECNYSEETGVRAVIMRTHKVVHECKTKMERLTGHLSADSHYVEPNLIEKFI